MVLDQERTKLRGELSLFVNTFRESHHGHFTLEVMAGVAGIANLQCSRKTIEVTAAVALGMEDVTDRLDTHFLHLFLAISLSHLIVT